MKLILFRHGAAVDREVFIEQKKQDALRPLTPKGREKTLDMAEHLEMLMDSPDLLVCSPLLRAQETAAVIHETWPAGRLAECPELVPDAPPQAFANWLKTHANQARSVLAVGHEPQLSVFASWLLAGSVDSFLDLKKSGVIVLDIESFDRLGPRTAELKFFLNPKQVWPD